jgi:hypothetical protein
MLIKITFRKACTEGQVNTKSSSQQLRIQKMEESGTKWPYPWSFMSRTNLLDGKTSDRATKHSFKSKETGQGMKHLRFWDDISFPSLKMPSIKCHIHIFERNMKYNTLKKK